MADLKCMVENCIYNSEDLCSKGDIMVGGCHANTKEDTSCESFSQRHGDIYTSSLQHPSNVISIDCEATKCSYNSNYKCVADHVDIWGNGANDTKGTACVTFIEPENY